MEITGIDSNPLNAPYCLRHWLHLKVTLRRRFISIWLSIIKLNDVICRPPKWLGVSGLLHIGLVVTNHNLTLVGVDFDRWRLEHAAAINETSLHALYGKTTDVIKRKTTTRKLLQCLYTDRAAASQLVAVGKVSFCRPALPPMWQLTMYCHLRSPDAMPVLT